MVSGGISCVGKEKCGAQPQPAGACPIECFSECNPEILQASRQGLMRFETVPAPDGKYTIIAPVALGEEAKPSNMAHLENMIEHSLYRNLGYDQICVGPFEGTGQPRKTYLAKSIARFLAFSEYLKPDSIALASMAKMGISLKPKEVLALVPALHLSVGQIACMPGYCPEEKFGPNVPGVYTFTTDLNNLAQMIAKLEDPSVKIPEIDGKPPSKPDPQKKILTRRDEIKTYLNLIAMDGMLQRDNMLLQRGLAIAQKEQMDWMRGIWPWQAGVSAFVGALTFVAALSFKDWLKARSERGKIDQSAASARKIDKLNLKLTDVADLEVDKQEKYLREHGFFEKPYLDIDGKVGEIIEVVFNPQGDMKNYRSLGPSRAGKTATTELGLTQAWLVSRMDPVARAEFFKNTTQMMSPEDAAAYVRTTEANAARIAELTAGRGFKGFEVVSLQLHKLEGNSGSWMNLEASVLEHAFFDPVTRMEEGGTFVVVFIDESANAARNGGKTPLLDRLKETAEDRKTPFGRACTLDESQDVDKDPARANRGVPILHPAASPDKVVSMLMSRAYVRVTYKIQKVEHAAAQMVYALAPSARPVPSELAAAEMFYNDVLNAAQKRGLTELTQSFVIAYYREHHHDQARTPDIAALLDHPERIREVFEYETRAIAAENVKGREQFVAEVERSRQRHVARWENAALLTGGFVTPQPPPLRMADRPSEELALRYLRSKVPGFDGLPQPRRVALVLAVLEGLERVLTVPANVQTAAPVAEAVRRNAEVVRAAEVRRPAGIAEVAGTEGVAEVTRAVSARGTAIDGAPKDTNVRTEGQANRPARRTADHVIGK